MCVHSKANYHIFLYAYKLTRFLKAVSVDRASALIP